MIAKDGERNGPLLTTCSDDDDDETEIVRRMHQNAHFEPAKSENFLRLSRPLPSFMLVSALHICVWFPEQYWRGRVR